MEAAELQIIKKHHEKALECLNVGLQEDQLGNRDRAVVLYRLGRRHILQGLAVPTPKEGGVVAGWDSARHMQLKMQDTLSSITTRLDMLETTCSQGVAVPQPLCLSLQATQRPLCSKVPRFNAPLSPSAVGGVPWQPPSPKTASDVPSDLPPVYTPQPTDGGVSVSHREGCWLPRPDRASQRCSQASMREPEEILLFIPNGVQIFFVAPDGHLSAPSYPGFLRIILNSRRRCDNDNNSDIRHPPAFLQVCDWHYPLFPDSPVLLSNTGVFTFPDTTATGSYVGLVLSSELPASHQALFQEHLSVLTQLRIQEAGDGADEDTFTRSSKANEMAEGTDPERDRDTAAGPENRDVPEWSEKMSHNILAGASWLSQGLVQGAEATGKAIHKGAIKLREHITPDETPAEVQPRVRQGLQVAKEASEGAVKVSRFLVNGLSTVVGFVGKELGHQVKSQGSKLLPQSLKNNQQACTNMGGAKVVAASSLKGLSTIWSGLETAAKTVGKSAKSETVQTVQHKYGDAGGQAAEDAFQSAVNVGVMAFNMDNLALKAVLKGTGKQTTRALLEEEDAREGKIKKEEV